MNKQSKVGLILSCACLVSCAQAASPGKTRARVTFYNAHEDKFGSRIAIGGRARDGVTCAAERGIPFGTRVEIPMLGERIVQDRGRDVNLRRASKGLLPVFDIFVADRARYNWFTKNFPPIVDVIVHE